MYRNKREIQLMDRDWRFHRGDLKEDKVVEHHYTYELCKTTRGNGPAATIYPDENWKCVTLPHDFLLEELPSPDENGIKGSYARPNAWYRKYFRLDDSDRAKRISLLFEGIATHSVVYLNGHLLYRSFSGYSSFEVDIADFARFGEELNVLSVYINNHESEGWWYEGAGIYRHVWLIKTGLVSVDTWGTFVRTQEKGEDLHNTRIDTELRNDLFEAVNGRIVSTIFDQRGKKVANSEARFSLSARKKATIKQEILVAKPDLWSPDAPNMYIMTTKVYANGQLTDDYETPFGYRTLRFDPDEGFFINGVSTKIKGLCIHQDHGGLGSAVPDSVQEFRVRQLKSAGSNALRSTHNPAPPSLLDACDRLGMMMMDENRYLVSSKQRMGELRDMIRRDRNHPSIVFWSIFNEDAIMDKPAGAKMFHAMYALAEKLDDTRAIIGAPNKNVGAEGYIASSNVMGFNYNFELVDSLHRCWHKPHVNTETHQGNYLGGNDGWRLAALRPYVMGIFCWGVETRGETYWPRLYAPWGILDGQCYPKHHYELYRNSYWADRPSIKIVPMLDYPEIHRSSPCWLDAAKPRLGIGWSPRYYAGKTVDVWVYTTAPRVELLLNGKSLGIKYADPFEQVCWHVPYEHGELIAIGRDKDGVEIVRDVLRTTKDPVALKYELHNDRVYADGEDCAVVTAYAVDEDGAFVPDADGIAVDFSVSAQGTLLSVANSDATDHHVPKDPHGSLWNGRCQVVLRSELMEGDIVLSAKSEKLDESSLTIKRAAAAKRAIVESVDSCYITSIELGNHFDALDDIYAADKAGKVTWTHKRFDKRLYTDLPVGLNVVPYRLDLTVPDVEGGRCALQFDHVSGRVHVQVVDSQGNLALDLRDENADHRILLNLPDAEPGDKLRVYIGTQIDPPTYFGPNPYWRFVGMYGVARWVCA